MNRTHSMLGHAKSLTRRKAFAVIAILSATLVLNGCGGDATTGTGPALSADATLSALLIDTGTLTPAFATATTSYTAAVPNGTPFEIVRPSSSNANAKITVNSVAVASGSATQGIALAVGANTISIVVTAEDQVTTKIYSIVVTRAP